MFPIIEQESVVLIARTINRSTILHKRNDEHKHMLLFSDQSYKSISKPCYLLPNQNI